MNRLYSKFDNICEQEGTYKVHAMADTYVVSGYKGKTAQEKRTLDDAITEAFAVLQVAH